MPPTTLRNQHNRKDTDMKGFKRLVVSILLVAAVSVAAADWTAIVPSFKDSVVEIAIGERGACTGWVIDNNRDFVMTAAHCDVENATLSLFADNMKAEVRAKDAKHDLMVLYVKDIDRPALKLAKNDPKVGDEVASFGYGFALERPLFRVTHISAADIAIERARYFVTDANFVPGMSGGPVFNQKGEVVMIVQMGSNVGLGLGVGAETIEDRMGRFFTLEGAK